MEPTKAVGENDPLLERAREVLPSATLAKMIGGNREAIETILQYETEMVTPERLDAVMPALLKAEEDCYPEDMRDGEEHLRWIADKGPLMTLNIKDEIAGYVSSCRGSTLPETLEEDDDPDEGFFGVPSETKEYCTDDVLYVWNVSITPKHQQKHLFTTLLYPATIQKAVEGGYKKMVFHSRVSENLVPLYEQKYGCKVIRRVENWFPDSPEELFDLVEIDLDPKTNPKIAEVLTRKLPFRPSESGIKE
ncbi:MAG: GNAT family N-acetyltransferase [Candidatus Peribacteraceae bacterium]|nr:GNAT family N-acetyltransferase [Candidatus Peribacteraceae bacterium]MDD5742943.1 GNAT family N-acetyltransferase [Candidatus Peribacteraceae bacterium]